MFKIDDVIDNKHRRISDSYLNKNKLYFLKDSFTKIKQGYHKLNSLILSEFDLKKNKNVDYDIYTSDLKFKKLVKSKYKFIVKNNQLFILRSTICDDYIYFYEDIKQKKIICSKINRGDQPSCNVCSFYFCFKTKMLITSYKNYENSTFIINFFRVGEKTKLLYVKTLKIDDCHKIKIIKYFHKIDRLYISYIKSGIVNIFYWKIKDLEKNKNLDLEKNKNLDLEKNNNLDLEKNDEFYDHKKCTKDKIKNIGNVKSYSINHRYFLIETHEKDEECEEAYNYKLIVYDLKRKININNNCTLQYPNSRYSLEVYITDSKIRYVFNKNNPVFIKIIVGLGNVCDNINFTKIKFAVIENKNYNNTDEIKVANFNNKQQDEFESWYMQEYITLKNYVFRRHETRTKTIIDKYITNEFSSRLECGILGFRLKKINRYNNKIKLIVKYMLLNEKFSFRMIEEIINVIYNEYNDIKK